MQTDETLIDASRSGDRSAFGEIVRRYQNLISSIAYSATGDLTRSEEIAQQTFVTAWQKQDDLHDPGRLVGWLAGIARNLVRRDFRNRKSHATVPVESATNVATDAPTPLQQCMSEEQKQLLWSVLQQIPETYREPLILFHREGQSVAEVARQLELSEDAVKQRLSRGRQMLRQEVTSFVEGALSESSPGEFFSAGVLAALPSSGVAASGAAAIGAAGKVAAKLATLKTIVLLGPLIGVAGAAFGCWNSLRKATSKPERRFMWTMIGLLLVVVGGLLGTQWSVRVRYPDVYRSPVFQGGLWGIYTILLVASITLGNRRIMQIKMRHGTDEEKRGIRTGTRRPVSVGSIRWGILGGHFGATCWLFVAAALAQDWIGLAGFLVLVVGSGLWLSKQAEVTQRDALQQAKLGQKAVLISSVVGAFPALVRWDYWASRIPFGGYESIPGWALALGLVGFGIALSLLMRLQSDMTRPLTESDDSPAQA